MEASPRFNSFRTLVSLSWLSMSAVAFSQEAPPEDPVAAVEPVAVDASQQPTVTNVYKNDFSERIEIGKWSHTATPRSPSGRRILRLDRHSTFNQGDLPEHEFIRLRMKLVPIGSFDGSDAEFGPDRFSLVVRGGTTLMRTTFGNLQLHYDEPNPRLAQAYPDDEIAAAPHPSGTGSSIRKMAHAYPNAAEYDIELAFPHRGDELVLEFLHHNIAADDEEIYGLSSIEVDVVSGAAKPTEEEYAELWEALVGKDPARANEAVTELIACGKAGAEYVRKKSTQGEEGDGERAKRMKALAEAIKKAMGSVAGDDFQERVTARAALKKLHPDAIPLLEAELKKAKSKEAQSALRSVIKSLKAKLKKVVAGDHELRVQSRIAKILRVWDIAASGRTIKASSGSLPTDTLDDGYAPLGKIKGVVVPRFEFSNSAEAPHDEWVQYEFPVAKSFDSAEVLWMGKSSWASGASVPESWLLSYLDGDEWKPVKLKANSKYGITSGKMNRVEFEPVRAKAIRLEVVEKEGHYAGLFEWHLGESTAKSEPAQTKSEEK